MRLYPLALPTKEAAIYHADVHLRPCTIIASKILSDAMHCAGAGQKKILEKFTTEGDKEYYLDVGDGHGTQTKIMSPSKRSAIWSKWVSNNSFNAWWLVDFAFQLNMEFKFRFGGADFPEYLKMQSWVSSGGMKLFPRPQRTALDDFPLVLPPEEVIKIGSSQEMTVVEIYRAYYIAQKNKIRYRWTRRTPPPFSFPPGDVPF